MRRALAIAVVVLAASVPYLPTLNDYFVQDDFGVVSLLAEKPANAFFGWFTHTWMDDIWGHALDEVRPFQAVTYQVTAWWGAASPVANHVLNIALHAATALLVMAVGVEAAGLGLAAAAFAGVVFALNPAHAETVAWITGRVDSLPALFYIASFLAYVRWRTRGAVRLYWAAVALCAVALLSKQNTVTLAPALVLFDLLVGRRQVRPAWSWLRAYVPFVALTAAYLALRYVLFGEMAREGSLSGEMLALAAEMGVRHTWRIVGGAAGPVPLVVAGTVVLLVAATMVLVRDPRPGSDAARRALYFGAIWTALGLAPTLVAGYESPRHVYLASAGWALTLGIAADVLWREPVRKHLRPLAAAAALAVVSACAVDLRSVVHGWRQRADVSRRAAIDLEREVLAAPPGSLVLVDAPRRSWEWALPFVARPPFASDDLTRRAVLVYPPLLHCCRAQWERDMRHALDAWRRGPAPRHVVALAWDEETGALTRRRSDEEPYLGALAEALPGVDNRAAFERVLHGATTLATATRSRR